MNANADSGTLVLLYALPLFQQYVEVYARFCRGLLKQISNHELTLASSDAIPVGGSGKLFAQMSTLMYSINLIGGSDVSFNNEVD